MCKNGNKNVNLMGGCAGLWCPSPEPRILFGKVGLSVDKSNSRSSNLQESYDASYAYVPFPSGHGSRILCLYTNLVFHIA